MISKRKIHDIKVDSIPDSTNSERKSITAQDYKKMLQKDCTNLNQNLCQ